MSDKMVICKVCGTEMAKSAKSCPQCGAKNKKPIYKRAWLWILVIIVLIGVVGGSGGSEEANDGVNVEASAGGSNKVEQRTYEQVDLEAMFDELDANALRAEQTYQDKYITVTGKLDVIDSDGKYIAISDPDDDWGLRTLHCSFTDDSQADVVVKKNTGDLLTIKGKVTSIGEVLGYTMDVHSIE